MCPCHVYLVEISPDVILCGWLGFKHQLTNLVESKTVETILLKVDTAFGYPFELKRKKRN